MTDKVEKELFDSLCAAESYRECGALAESGIGIYNEKRLHKILKRTVCDKDDCFEVKVGRYVADVLDGDTIFEIQCASFAPLCQKLEYYLAKTEYKVCVVCPMIAKKTVIRAQRETGEILRMRVSSKKEGIWHALAKLYPIRHLLDNERLTVKIMLVEAEEYRYSEAVRYRKKGKYDSELFPTVLVDSIELCGVDDYKNFLPEELRGEEFSAADFAKLTKLKSRDAYSALNTLAEIGLLSREKQGRAVRYSLKLD